MTCAKKKFRLRRWFVQLLAVLLLFQTGCGPLKQERYLHQLDASAVNTINELVVLYESIESEREAKRSLAQLCRLHDNWLENRKKAAALELENTAYQRSWQRYQNEMKGFEFRIRLRRKLNDYRVLDPFHRQVSSDFLLLPAR